jgi:methylenetetrahydrofolate reductase (NADPH)
MGSLAVGTGATLKPTWRYLLEETDQFVIGVELVTSRGMISEPSGKRSLTLARYLAQHPRINVLSITDNPGGNAMLSADVLGTDLIARGQEVIIHLSCKDWNRNALQSHGWELASSGFDNVLALSGDCPVGGYAGQSARVFDIDSVALTQMLSDMNRCLVAPAPGGGQRVMQPTNFFIGAVVTNFKRYENEVMPQYFKLAKKIRAGAAFIINQLGYDARKQDELLRYMALHNLNVPVICNVYVLGARAAKYYHDGKIPGCVVTDELLALAERHGGSPDKGKAFFLEFAAKQVAIAKGLGYRGAYLGGHIKPDDYLRILDIADTFAPDDWKLFAREIQFGQSDEFYYFEQDPDTLLGSSQINRQYLASKTPEALAKARLRGSVVYKLNRFVHAKFFVKGTGGFKLGQKLYTHVDQSGKTIKRLAHAGEHIIKSALFNCRDCGDCSLPDIAYLCPHSQCAKNQRNGPCGGTRDGLCEVEDTPCIWASAYDRLKPYGEEESIFQAPVIYKDGALQGTSAWANTYLERDHTARQAEQAGASGTTEVLSKDDGR